MRVSVELPSGQMSALAAYCGRERVSRSEAIRRGVALLLADEPKADARPTKEQRDAALKAAFGAWKDRGIDTDTYLSDLRAEWDRDWDRSPTAP